MAVNTELRKPLSLSSRRKAVDSGPRRGRIGTSVANLVGIVFTIIMAFPAYWMINTSIGVKATDNIKLRLIVDNVFNLGIPYPYTSYSQNKYYDAIMGRYFRFNVGVTF